MIMFILDGVVAALLVLVGVWAAASLVKRIRKTWRE